MIPEDINSKSQIANNKQITMTKIQNYKQVEDVQMIDGANMFWLLEF
jgi:hypothetical protein